MKNQDESHHNNNNNNNKKHRSVDSSSQFLGRLTIVTALLCLVIALLFFVIGVPGFTKYVITREARLINGSETWKKWTKVESPIFIKFHIFNITNADDVLKKGSKFDMEEKTYVWEEKRSKEIMSIDEDEDSVTYKEIIHYYYRPDLSAGSEEDTVDILNIPYIGATSLIYKKLYWFIANGLVNTAFVRIGETLFLRGVKIRDLVFDGVRIPPLYSNLAQFNIDDELPPEFINGTFALLNGRNGTAGPELKASRGVNNYQDFGRILTYEGQEELSWWTDKSLTQQYCNQINGSDGSVIPPFVAEDRVISLFSASVCRSIYFTFRDSVRYEGIPAYRFILPDDVFESPDVKEENGCFCQDPGNSLANECVKGMMRLFPCKQGNPFVLSKPHFAGGAESLINGVSGLKPNHSLHDTELIVEPNTGVILRIRSRMQFSLELQPLPNIDAFKNVPYAVVPVFWVEEEATLTKQGLSDIKSRLINPLKFASLLQWIIYGLCMIAAVVGVKLTLRRSSEDNIPLATNNA